MSKYIVTIPIAGAIHIEVDVQTGGKQAAIDAAWARYHDLGPESGELEWEAFTSLTRGNVVSPRFNDIEVNEE